MLDHKASQGIPAVLTQKILPHHGIGGRDGWARHELRLRQLLLGGLQQRHCLHTENEICSQAVQLHSVPVFPSSARPRGADSHRGGYGNGRYFENLAAVRVRGHERFAADQRSRIEYCPKGVTEHEERRNGCFLSGSGVTGLQDNGDKESRGYGVTVSPLMLSAAQTAECTPLQMKVRLPLVKNPARLEAISKRSKHCFKDSVGQRKRRVARKLTAEPFIVQRMSSIPASDRMQSQFLQLRERRLNLSRTPGSAFN